MIKGELWWVNLPAVPYGSEPGKRRPVVILQNDAFNHSAIQTTICAIITSNIKLAEIPPNILLEKNVSGLERTSVINFSQIITIDRSRLTELVSMLPKNYIAKINASVRVTLINLTLISVTLCICSFHYANTILK